MVDSDASVAWRLFHLNWIPIAAMGGILLFAVVFSNFSIEPVAFSIPAGIAVALGLIAYLYAFAKADLADPKLVFTLGAISQLLFVVTIMGPFSYVAGATAWPLQDHTFLAIDRALGMDPEMIARFVDQHDPLADWLARFYGLIKWPLLGIPIVLCLTSRLVRLQMFVFAFSMTLIVTIAISALVPAVGTFYGLQISPSQFPSLDVSMYAAQLRDIMALRDGSLRHLEVFKLAGIVSFPSFHAASGILYMWALWPVRRIGGIAVALNLLMISATPVIGAHYMIDVLGGIALAAVSAFLVRYFRELAVPSPLAAEAAQSPAASLLPVCD